MANLSALKASPKTTFFMISSSGSNQQRSFPFQFMMSITIVILLVGFCPSVSSSPTPPSSSINQNKDINYDLNGLMFEPSDYQATSPGDASLLPPTVQHSLSGSSPLWYVQPRTHANQFLLSHDNDKDVIVPKWYSKFHNDDQINDINNDDDDFDDVPSGMFFNKRSTAGNNGGFLNLKKGKQLSKPPMEVMNEIVNSIYLKR